jgi:hypothetical protein
MVKSIDDLDTKITQLQTAANSKYQEKDCTVVEIDTMTAEIAKKVCHWY